MPSLFSITWALTLASAPGADRATAERRSAHASDPTLETSDRGPTGSELQGFETPLEPDHKSASDRNQDAPRAARSSQSTASSLPMDGAAPLSNDALRADDGSTPTIPDTSEQGFAAPFGAGPTLSAPKPPDPRTIRILRINVQTGVVLRLQRPEPVLTTNIELGQKQGLSASFHTSMIVAPDRGFVRVYDFPIGFGVIARGRARNKPLYGSVGLSAGILVHRANTELGVIHRVDPDLRLPLRGTWTPKGGKLGLSVAIVQGWSVRRRSYERRGITVWTRLPYRIGIVFGLHFDIRAGRTKLRPFGGPRRRDHVKH